MVVQDLGRKEVDFTRQCQCDNKSLRAVSLSGFDEPSQVIPFNYL
jgi:hypothetical protein